MKPAFATMKEGGEWLPWHLVSSLWSIGLLHSVKFENGAEWDAVNGFRKRKRVRVKMGRAVV